MKTQPPKIKGKLVEEPPNSLDEWKVLLKSKKCRFKSLYRVSEFFWHYLPLRTCRKMSLGALSVLFCCPDFRELEPITAIEKTRLKARRPSSSEIKWRQIFINDKEILVEIAKAADKY